ncbi:SH3 domain-containing protein [Mesorhizobium sp.]|uniref:SH3 domain-containing protein n=1 Tax=Mesorhizobium sp. TaxID=1871066 RepID=UPI000FE64E34|nr:SH3 domain-containing protein [Mesorhizobium sp.]RWP64132.1 MAG: hypothetical protein EOR07_16225 [Mesorhizobium sp.]
MGALLLATILPAKAELTYETGQTVDGASFVVVAGAFEAADDLDSFRETVRSHNVQIVGFNSPGGNVAKALELGRLIRAFGLDTFQIKRSECASACALAFMGGVRRMAEAGGIGVHRSSFANPDQIGSGDATAAVQDMTAEMIDFMIEMGVDPALLRLSHRYGSDDMRYLSRSEMAQYRVVTGDTTASAPIVKTTTPPAGSVDARFQIPDAISGRIRSSQKVVSLKLQPNTDAREVGSLANGTAVQIIGNSDRWYRVRAGDLGGFLPQGTVAVDQYESGSLDQRYIQVKSLSDFPTAEAYARSSPIPFAVHLSNNGMFAIARSSERRHDGKRRHDTDENRQQTGIAVSANGFHDVPPFPPLPFGASPCVCEHAPASNEQKHVLINQRLKG